MDKVVCVHVLPVLMQLVVFLVEDLGESILIELCSRWNSSLEEQVSSKVSVKSSLLQIMTSIGCSPHEISAAELAPSIKEMLDSFCVGTEKKKKVPLPPKDDLLCRLADYKPMSTSKSIKNVFNKKRKVVSSLKFPDQPTVLKTTSLQDVLEPIVCDFCKKETNTSNHVCREIIPGGPRSIEGSSIRICGLSTCIECKLKYKLEEDEFRVSCPIHCKARSIDPDKHPLLLESVEAVKITDSPPPRGEMMEITRQFPTFTPDYERMKYLFDGLASFYSSNKDTENISEFPGIRVFQLRASAKIKAMNRRNKYMKNERKSLYKKLKESMNKATTRIKVRKATSKRKDDDDDDLSILNVSTSNNESSQSESSQSSTSSSSPPQLLFSSQSSFTTSTSQSSTSPSQSSTSPSQSSNTPSQSSNTPSQSSTSSLSQSSTSSSQSSHIPHQLFQSSTSNLLSSSQSSTSSSHTPESFQSSTSNLLSPSQSSTSSPSNQSSATSSTPSLSISDLLPSSQSSNSSLPQLSSSTSSHQPLRRSSIVRRLPTTMPRDVHTAVTVPAPEFTLRKERKQSVRGCSFKCCFANCQNNSNTEGVTFKKIPMKPIMKADMSIPRNVRTYHKKLTYHNLLMTKCGLKDQKWRASLRFCSAHTNKTMKVREQVNVCGVREEIDFIFKDVPTGDGVDTEINSLSVYDRCSLRDWKRDENEIIEKHGEDSAKEILKYKKAFLGCFSPATLEKKHGINPRVAKKIDIPMMKLGETSSRISDMLPDDDEKKRRTSIVSFKVVDDTSVSNKTISRRKPRKSINSDLSPVITPRSEPASEIKRRTGFVNEEAMMRFIIIACNGDTTLMEETVTNELTWFEEWFLFFEVEWLRTHTRWEDTAKIFKKSNIRELRKAFDTKNLIVLACRASWPTYLSFEEDKALRDEKWNIKYGEKRIIMWDDTNVPFTFKPSRADNQRLTYSSYYGMNCAKGGVFMQLSGWMGVEELWVGATSDSHYQKHNKIFEKQKEFAESDLVNDKVLPFSNVFDKGYRCILDAHRAGNQECIQPIFAKCDRRFAGKETVSSASVASDRSGNERGVNLSKKAGYIKRGLVPGGCPKRLNNVWMAWGFQVNFMYKPVL